MKGNEFWWQGVYYCGPAHLRFMMGTARFVVAMMVPYHKFSVSLNFSNLVSNVLIEYIDN